MLPRRTLVTVVVLLMGLVGGVGVASASPAASGTQAAVNVTTFVAPGDAVDAVRAGTVEDVLTRRPRVTLADTLVVRVSAPGLGAAVADQPGNTTTDRFRQLVSSADASLTGTEITSRDTPRALDLTATQLVVRRTGEDAYDLVYHTGELRASDDADGNGLADDGDRTPISPVKVFSIKFSFEGTAGDSSLGVFPASMTFTTSPTDELVLYPLPGQRLVGRTPLAPGTTVTLSLATEDGAVAVERRVRVTGGRQSFANLSLNLSGAPGGVPLTVTARLDGERLRETTGRLAALTASFTPDLAATSRDRLGLRNVSFATGGFLVVRDGADGPLIANRYVEAGSRAALSVPFRQAATADSVTVAAYVDVDGDRLLERSGPDRPFRRNGDPLSTVVELGDSGATTPTDPTTDAPTPSTTDGPVDTPPASPPAANRTGTRPSTPYGITDASGDGFGPVLALVALAVGLAALGRRD